MRKLTPIGIRTFVCTFLILAFYSDVVSQQFDIAISKTTVTTAPVKFGTSVPFNITIYNQGTDTIMNVELIDHYNEGFDFQMGLNPDWDSHPTIPNAATTTYTEKVPPGENRTVTINLLAQRGDSADDWINTAEVVDFTDRFGNSQEAADTDSSGDEMPDNDAGGLLGSPADDYILGDGTGAMNDGVAATDEDDHDRDTVQIFDLALTKVLDPITGYTYGDTLIFTTTVYNQGNTTVTNVRVRDIVPEGYFNPLDINTANGWSNNAANPLYTIAELAPFEEVSFDISLVLVQTQADGDAWINYAEILSARAFDGGPLGANLDADSEMASNTVGERSVNQGDPLDNEIINTPTNVIMPDPNDDQDDHDPAEPVIFDLALIKERTTALASFNYNTPISYTFTVVNQGNVSATDIVVVDSLPCGAMFEEALNPNWIYDPLTRIATTTIPFLDPFDAVDNDHIYIGELILTVIPCFEDQETAWTNYMEISQATTADGVQTTEIDGVFDGIFGNDPGGVPGTSSDNNLNGLGIVDEDNHDVELLQVYDLALKKELVTEGPYTEGQDLEFKITVYNQGNIVIEDLVIEDFVPEGFGYTLADNSAFGWTNSYSTLVNGVQTTFPDTLNVMEDIFLATEDSVEITMILQLELDGTDISDWYNYVHVWVATDTIGNNRFDDADSNPFMPTDAEFAVLPDSPNDNNIFSPGKSVMPAVEEDDHDVANISFFDLSLSKTATSPIASIGETVSFDIVVRNEGVQFAHDITVVDYLPCGFSFTSSPGWALNATTGNPEYFYTDTLYAGEEVTIPITLTVEECLIIDADSYRNEAEILSALNDDDTEGDDQDSTPNNQDPDEDDLDDAALDFFDLALTKTLITNVANITYGQNLNYQITVTNEGTLTATSFTVTDFLPCGLTFSGSSNTGWIQDAQTGNITFEESTPLNPGSSTTIDLVLTLAECAMPNTSSWNNIVEITEANDPSGPADDIDSTPNNGDPDEDDIDNAFLEVGDLSLSKSHINPAGSISVGTEVDFSITVTNQGNVPMNDFTIVDYLPCGLGFSTANNTGWTTTSSGDVEFLVTTPLAPGASTTIPLTLTVETCLPPTSPNYTNRVEIGDQGPNPDDPDSTPDNEDPDEDDYDEDPFEWYDLSLSKTSVTPSDLKYGDVLIYTITVLNEGSLSATNVEVTDYLPCGLSFSTANNTGWILNPSTGNVSSTYAGTINPGEIHEFTLRLTVEECTGNQTNAYNNSAEISGGNDPSGAPGDDTDSTPNNQNPNEDDQDDQPLDVFDLSLTKTVTSTQSGYAIGEEVVYAISVSNEGNVPATGFEITDYIPCGMTLASSNSLGWTMNSQGNAEYTYPNTILPGNNQSFEIRLVVTACANETGDRRNTAEITNNGNGNPTDADSTPNNQNPNEDDQDDSTISVITETTIGDFVWNDLDGDGIQDGNEPGLAGVVVILYTAEGDVVAIVETGSDGAYEFEDVASGDYYIVFDLEDEDYIPSPVNSGNDANDSNVTEEFGEGSTSVFTVISGQNNTTIDAGFFICSLIKGVTYYDVNEDDIRQPTENGINGLMVNLFRRVNGSWVLWDSETTHHDYDTPSDDGIWDFCVAPGQYYIEVMMPPIGLVRVRPFVGGSNFDSDINGANGVNTTPTFTINPGGSKTDLGAGYYPMATVGNRVWHDENYNGIQDSNEAKVEGVTVQVFNMDHELVDEAVTNADGVYKVEYLKKEEYYLKFEAPTGYTFTSPGVGEEDTDSDVDHSMGFNTTSPRLFNPGENVENIDAGLAFGVLPLDWVDVSVERRGERNQVSWITTNELNVSHFEVEVAINEDFDFTKIGEVAAENTIEKSTYSLVDPDSKTSGHYYYRIKQVDLDGKYEYSKIVKIEVVNGFNSMNVYPNPAIDNAKLRVDLLSGSKVEISIFDNVGRRIRSYLIDESTENISTIIEIDNLSKGVYTIQLIQNQLEMNKKIIIIK